MLRRPRTLSLALVVLIPAATGCGARSALSSEDPEASWRCPGGSRAGAVGCGTLTFAEPVHYISGAGESGQVVIADLDGDGRLDLAVSGHDGAIAVLLNEGGGVFSDAVLYPAPLWGIGRLAAGDLNQDGIDDLVATPAADDGDSLAVLLNDGHGALEPTSLYVGAPHLSGLALGDLDGDDLLDIAVASVDDNLVHVLSNRGDGTFEPIGAHGPVKAPVGLAVADLDGDGDKDLVVQRVALSGGGVSLFLGAGGGTFTGPISYPYTGSILGVADISGDGRPDLLQAVSSDLSVRLNAGDATFNDALRYPVAENRNTISAAIADLNGDCRPDLAAVSEDDLVRVLPNLGQGDFGPPGAHAVKGGTYSIAAGDLDGDGAPDLAVAYIAFDRVTVLLNRGCEP
jgi:hypothetical protein